AGKYRVQEAERVACKDEAFHGAVSGMMSVFAGDEVVARLAATSQVILNPEILADLAFENGFRRFHPVAREIFAFRHDSDAHHVIVEWNEPEPSLLRNVGDSRGARINAGVALGSAVIGPNGDFVQMGVAYTPVVSADGEGFLARTIEDDPGAVLG